MFKASDQIDHARSGPPPGAAALCLAQVLAEPAEDRGLVVRLSRNNDERERARRGMSGRLVSARHRVEAHFAKADLAPDLAENIGSARWFRGLGTMLTLSVAALSFWPDFSALEAATATTGDAAIRDEMRSQMIMPLALGGDSGRSTAPTSAVVALASAPERPTVVMAATLGQGDSFGRMLQRAGVGAGDADRVSAMVSAAVPLGQIGAGTRFDIILGRRSAAAQPRPLEKLDFRARFDLDLAIARSGGALVLTRRPIAVDATPLRIRGTVGPSLYRSARAAGAPAKAIQQYLQTLDSRVSLDGDIAPGDLFDIVLSYRRSAGGESEVGDLLYAGLEHGGKPRVQLLRWGKDGQFFEASGIGHQASGVFAPVAGRLTSGFGMRRHPVLGYTRMHSGVDYGAGWGTPIHAVSDGVVAYAGAHGGHGNYVRLEHGGGMGTGYAHMSRFAVSSGARVRGGQVIGYVGSTGLSTGPHLHYEVYSAGRKVDPLSVRFSVRAEVDKGELAAFKAKLAQMKAVEPGKALQSLAPRQAVARIPAGVTGRNAKAGD